ncbi:MAG TPA: S8 family serine peptidase, partial [Mycobacterium sp.]|nr:S8 family serine peptidase [Mycobacterium sp.]
MPVAAAQNTVSQSYIVVFKDAAADRADSKPAHPRVDADKVARLVEAIASRIGAHPANTFSSVFGGFSARLNASQLQAVQSDQSVANVVADLPVHLQFDEVGARMTETQVRLTAPKVPAGIKRVGATNNAIADIDGNGGKVNADVAVIDTGIQRDHPDLNVVGGYNCTSSNRGKWDDGNGHGTHVAGIIGAYDNGRGVVGVAPGVRLWAVKVLDDTGNGLMSWIVCGIDWITSQRVGAGSRPLIDVANMSLRSTLPQGDDHHCGRTYRDPMHSALCRSVAAGTTYVVAAGNDRDNASHYRPAAYDEAITVSAMTDYDGVAGGNGKRPAVCPAGYPDDTFAGFSNFGLDVDLIAPGVCVLSTWAGSFYAYASGTSMAAPHVAGAAALYLSQFPGAQPDQVKMALQHVGRTDWKRSTDPDGRPDLLLWASGFDRPPDFSVAATSPAGYAGPTARLAVPVSLTRLRGFSATITVSMSGLPAGLSAAPVTTGNDRAVLTVTGSDKVRNGKYTATVVATDGGLRHSTTVTIRVDGIPPTPPTSVTPGAGFWYSPDGQVTVRWSGSTDSGSGASRNAYVRRRVAPTSGGRCGYFTNDADWALVATGYSEDGLHSGYCYRWQICAADQVGNASDPVSSGKVLVDTNGPKVTISKPAPGSTIVKARPRQV